MNYDHLIEFATQRQLDFIESIKVNGSIRNATKALGINPRTLERSLQALKLKAAQRGLSPEHGYTKAVPDGFKVAGVSQYFNTEGALAGQWVKSSVDKERSIQLLKEAVEAMCDDIPRLGAIDPPMSTYGNLCNVYTLTDSHVGMLAWDVETKSGDWDLNIAERTLVGCFEQMVLSSPAAKTCVIAQLGDYLHYDSALAAVTPQHGHALDADGRMPKMVKVAIRVLRRVIDLALSKHDKVVVLLAEGNHDISSSVWLRAMFQAMYENEPRLEVIDSELPYYTYQHGDTMLAWHHGHLTKKESLPLLFASQFPKVWGSTTKRYVHCGHQHHVDIKEYSGMTVEQHATLASRDAYAARGGWIAERQVTAITYSDKYGQVARNTVTPEMLS